MPTANFNPERPSHCEVTLHKLCHVTDSKTNGQVEYRSTETHLKCSGGTEDESIR